MTRFVPLSLLVLVLVLASGCGRHHVASPSAERPGLGTAWGETRRSPVREVPFERADPANPTGLATLRYDDRAGLTAAIGPTSYPDDDAAVILGGALMARLLDEGGRPLPVFHRGHGHYVEGREGERYVIEIQNRSGARFEVVATVDGLDVLDGQPGSFGKRGYLVGPGGRLRIDGFRQTLDQVAAFRFGPVSASYAALKGNDSHVGVIGLAVFAERGAPPARYEEAERRAHADPFPGRFAPPPRSR